MSTTRTTSYESSGQPVSQRVNKPDPKYIVEEPTRAPSPVSGLSNEAGGRDLSIVLEERLGFLADEQRGSTSPYAFDIYGEASAGAIPKSQQGKRQLKESNTVSLIGKSSTLDFLKPIGKSFQSGVKDFGLQLVSLGPATVVTVKELAKTGKPVESFMKGSEAAIKFYEEKRDPDTGLDISRKAGEFVAGAYVFGAAMGGPSGGGAIATGISRSVKVAKAEKVTQEPGIISGKEKIGPNEYLISRGTEKKPAEIPYTALRFGKKGGATFENIKAVGERPTYNLSPNEIYFRGKLDPLTQKKLGTEKLTEFSYRVEKTTPTGRRTYQEGLFGRQYQPIAEGSKGKLSDLTRGFTPGEKGLVQKPSSVFVEGKADPFIVSTEKYTPPKVFKPKPLSPPSGESISGAGSSGKSISYAKRLTPQQSTTVKELIKSGTKQTTQKQTPDILFANPRIELMEKQKGSSQSIILSESFGLRDRLEVKRTQGGVNIFRDDLKTSTTRKTLSKESLGFKEDISFKKNQKDLLGASLKFRDEITTVKATRLSITPIESLKIQDDFSYKQGQGLKLDLTEKLTFVDAPPELLRPPKPPELLPPKIPIFGLPPGGGGRDFDSPSPPLGSNLDWRGNVPEFDIVGIYGKRKETTYTVGKVPGLKRKDRTRVAKPIKGFGSSNIQSLNITNKNNSFSGKGKSKTNIFRGVSAKKFRF